MGIVSHIRPGTRQVSIFTAELLGVQSLNCFVIHAADRVAVRQEYVSLSVPVNFQNGRFAEAATLQKQSASCNFRIRFVTSESSQERHA